MAVGYHEYSEYDSEYSINGGTWLAGAGAFSCHDHDRASSSPTAGVRGLHDEREGVSFRPSSADQHRLPASLGRNVGFACAEPGLEDCTRELASRLMAASGLACELAIERSRDPKRQNSRISLWPRHAVRRYTAAPKIGPPMLRGSSSPVNEQGGAEKPRLRSRTGD